MKSSIVKAVCGFALCVGALAAGASGTDGQAMPSTRLSTEIDIQPVAGQPGKFLVTSTITDLESNTVIAKPKLVIASDQPARMETGAQGQWLLQIAVAADGTAHRASYEETYTREGKVVSKQRFTIALQQ